jgi:hypothetical protein
MLRVAGSNALIVVDDERTAGRDAGLVCNIVEFVSGAGIYAGRLQIPGQLLRTLGNAVVVSGYCIGFVSAAGLAGNGPTSCLSVLGSRAVKVTVVFRILLVLDRTGGAAADTDRLGSSKVVV